jgi:microcystin degradation protein MlrC
MVDCADVIISYRTNPHVDRKERGAEAGPIMRRLLAGERFEKTFIRMPIAAPTVTLLTARGAYAEMISEGQKHIGPDLPVVSALGGFAFADAPEAGISILTYGKGLESKEVALKLAKHAWAERDRFKGPTHLTAGRNLAGGGRGPRTAPHRSLPRGRGRQPRAAAGAATRPTSSRGLLAAKVANALLGSFVDPAPRQRCHDAGVGAKIRVVLNEGRADAHAKEIPGRSRSAGALRRQSSPAGAASTPAARALMGQTAAVRIGGLTMVVCSRRVQCADPAFFEHLGLDVGSFSSLTVKSRGHFRAGSTSGIPTRRILEVDARGLTSPLLERFPWKALSRPSWPLDAETSGSRRR